MSVYQNINGTLTRMDVSDLVQLAAVDTHGILGGTPGDTTDGQTLVDQLAADDVQAQTDIGQIKTDLPNLFPRSEQRVLGAKNFIHPYSVSQVLNGYTFTVNADGTITVSGSPTDATIPTYFEIDYSHNDVFNLPVGDYILSGGLSPSEGSVFVNRYNGATFVDNFLAYSTAEAFMPHTKVGYTSTTMGIAVLPGVVFSTAKTFKPMIRLASDPDDTYVPYAPTNRECMSYAANTVLGAHNLLPNFAVAQTKNGITLAIDSDGVITANGTLTSNSTYFILNSYSTYGDLPIPSGKYRGSGAPKTYVGTATAVLNFYNFNGNSADNYDRGDGVALDYVRGSNFNVAIIVSGGVGKTVTNAKFYPMLTDIRDTDTTYAPYSMTNRELTDDCYIKKQTLIPANSDLNNYTKVGVYYTDSGAATTSLSNKPSDIDGAFVMHVEGRGPNYDGSIMQKIELMNTTNAPRIYIRYKPYASSWGSWYKFTGTAV